MRVMLVALSISRLREVCNAADVPTEYANEVRDKLCAHRALTKKAVVARIRHRYANEGFACRANVTSRIGEALPRT